MYEYRATGASNIQEEYPRKEEYTGTYNVEINLSLSKEPVLSPSSGA